MIKTKQEGFGIALVLLALVVVVGLGAAGYYVWHAQQAAKNNTTTSSTTQSHYVVIKEWGVRAPYSGSLTLEYNMDATKTTAYFTSKEMATSKDPGCGIGTSPDGVGGTIHNAGGGQILQFTGSEDISAALLGPDPHSAITAKQAYESATYKDMLTKVGSHYYMVLGIQGLCDDTSGTGMQTVQAVKDLRLKLQAIPQ